MLKSFQQYAKANKMFDTEGCILLAVSGGMDSVTMAHLFSQAKVNFAIAHCNFNLRGDESDADEAFVKKLAKKYKVSIHVKQFDTKAFAAQENISIQMAARALRYTWFQELIKTYDYKKIATAHHKSDSLETVLLNLVRGTGISGLHGIMPVAGKTIRPVLFADKDMIRDYVAEKQLVWREDSTNESNKYHRNLIRNEVIPHLKSLNPDLESTIEQTIEKVKSVENIYYGHVKAVKEKLLVKKGVDYTIDIHAIVSQNEGKMILWQLLESFNFNYIQSGAVYGILNNGSGKIFESPTHKLNIDRSTLIISPKNLKAFESQEITEQTTQLTYEGFELNFSIIEATDIKISSDKNIAFLDFEKLIFPLSIRKWKAGDWFIPLGMNKKKKLSDFMIDEKIPLNLKERIYVLVSGDSICWIVGNRIDDRYKITDKTEKAVKITYSLSNDQPL
ncbi:MAG: tRNA lysidine(34) synthetase TilS [Bacteroidota bacterium]|nr:tRNA lysidine(34) synthetase TilS [Bacteroidota bacterium]